MWPKQQIPQMYSPPQGRYTTHKRTRSGDLSGTESDESSSQDNTKKHRQDSPKITKAPPNTQNTKHNDSTPAQEEQTQSLLQEQQPQPTQQKIYQADGWGYFKNYRMMSTTTNPHTKNGGTSKSSTRTPAAPKNGKAPKDTKKTATK